MPACPVCLAEDSWEELVDEVFHVDDRYVLVSGAPATVCSRCGEQAFSRETVERVRSMIHGEAESDEVVAMQVFRFAS